MPKSHRQSQHQLRRRGIPRRARSKICQSHQGQRHADAEEFEAGRGRFNPTGQVILLAILTSFWMAIFAGLNQGLLQSLRAYRGLVREWITALLSTAGMPSDLAWFHLRKVGAAACDARKLSPSV